MNIEIIKSGRTLDSVCARLIPGAEFRVVD
jgi:hypothetical protein